MNIQARNIEIMPSIRPMTITDKILFKTAAVDRMSIVIIVPKNTAKNDAIVSLSASVLA